MTEDFELLEDDFLPCPAFEREKMLGKLPDFFDLSSKSGKLWFGHGYRMAHSVWHDNDSPARLNFMAVGFLAMSSQIPMSFIKECLALAISEIKEGRPGIPYPALDNLEKLAEWRERVREYYQEQDESLEKTSKQ